MLIGAVLLQLGSQGLLAADARFTVPFLVGAGAGIFFFLRGFRSWRRLRLIQDTPSSKVRSMALGRVELHGHAQGKGELAAPFTGRSCVYYRYQIEREVRGRRRSHWRTLDKGASECWPFYVEDDTGRVLVDPKEAEVDIPRDYFEIDPPLVGPIAAFLAERDIDPYGFLGLRKRLRFAEWHIAPGDVLYVLGVAQERGSLVHERRVRIAEKLAALKADREAMAHFDSDGNGHISAEEWEVARRLHVQQIEFEGFEDRVVVAKGQHAGIPFYISDRDEKEVVKKHKWSALGGIFGGALLTLVCLAGLLPVIGIFGR